MDPSNNEEHNLTPEVVKGAEHDKHFTDRRKILVGLAGVPVLVTFAPNVSAASSFGRCVANGTKLSDPNSFQTWYKQVDQNGSPLPPPDKFFPSKSTNGNQKCEGTGVVLSSACLTSFATSGGVLPTQTCK